MLAVAPFSTAVAVEVGTFAIAATNGFNKTTVDGFACTTSGTATAGVDTSTLAGTLDSGFSTEGAASGLLGLATGGTTSGETGTTLGSSGAATKPLMRT
jgi:hypothetical protein